MDPLFFWSLVLIATGLAVVVVELFIPSAGMLGVLATLLLVSGIVCRFCPILILEQWYCWVRFWRCQFC